MLEAAAQERRAYQRDEQSRLVSRTVDCIAYIRRVDTFWDKWDQGEAANFPQRLHSTLTQDDAGDNIRAYIDELRRILDQAASTAQGQIRSATTAEGSRFTRNWTAAVSASANIDVSLLVRDDDLINLLSLRGQEHVRLIKSLTEDVAARIERTALGSILEGRGNRETEKILSEMEGINRNRAKLIARDQASKLNGEMNSFRQTQAGITHYQWQTTMDGRQRDSHGARNGKTFAWDKPPQGGAPGREPNCRCHARAIIIDDEGLDVRTGEAPPLVEGAELDIAEAEPLLKRVASTPFGEVIKWAPEAIAKRRAELEQVRNLVAQMKGASEALEADLEQTFATVYGAPAPADFEQKSMWKAVQSRSAQLRAAINERLDLIGIMLEHADQYGPD